MTGSLLDDDEVVEERKTKYRKKKDKGKQTVCDAKIIEIRAPDVGPAQGKVMRVMPMKMRSPGGAFIEFTESNIAYLITAIDHQLSHIEAPKDGEAEAPKDGEAAAGVDAVGDEATSAV